MDVILYKKLQKFGKLVYKAENYNSLKKGFVKNDGAFEISDDYLTTDYIKVPDNVVGNAVNVRSVIANATVYRIAFYDGNYAFIGGDTTSQSSAYAQLTMPNNTVYFTLTVNADDVATCEAEFAIDSVSNDAVTQSAAYNYYEMRYTYDNFDWETGAVDQNGNNEALDTLSRTGYIKVPEGMVANTGMLLSPVTSTRASVAFYDSGKSFISKVTVTQSSTLRQIEIPEGTVYFRFTCRNDRLENFVFLLHVNSKTEIAAQTVNQKKRIDYVEDIVAPAVKYSEFEWTDGTCIAADGSEESSQSYSVTDYISLPALANREFTFISRVAKNTVASVVFYTNQKVFINSECMTSSVNPMTVYVPANAAYIRLCSSVSTKNLAYYRISVDRFADEISALETVTERMAPDVAAAKTSLVELNPLLMGNLLPDKQTGTSGGLTFTRVGYGHFIVNGTSTGSSMFNVLSSSTALPENIKRGRKYLLKFFTTNVRLVSRIYIYYPEGTEPAEERIYSGTRGYEFVMPDNAVGIVVRVFCGNANDYINEHVEIALYDSESIVGREKRFYKWAPRPMLTICDDDGRVLFYEQVLPLIKETGAPIASANTILRTETREATDALYKGREDYAAGRITSEELQAIQDHFDAVRAEARISTYPENYGIRFMNWDQIRECHANGAEIVSHTYGHFVEAEDMDMPENIVRGMYIKARHILEMHGIPCKCVVYAGPSDSNIKTRRCASYAFDYGIRASGERLNFVNGDPMQIRRFGIGGNLTPFESSDMIALVSGLLSIPTGWMILNIHTSSDDWDISKVDVLRDVITYCQTNNIPIVTYAAATHWYYELGYQPGAILDAESQDIL